jgi:hypothetical protein
MGTSNQRARRARIIGLGAAIAMVAMLLPGLAGIAFGHHTVPTVLQIDCNGNVSYAIYDWTTSTGTGGQATFDISYAVDGSSSFTSLGSGSFSSADSRQNLVGVGNVWVVTGSFSVSTSVTSVVLHVTNVVWGDANPSGHSDGVTYTSSSATRPTTCASPTLDTTPSAGGPIGTVINDTATLHNASNPTGSIAFKLFGPNDLTCSKDPIYTQSVALKGTSAATTPGFTSTVAGTYEWTAFYPGDTNNNKPASSGCGAEVVVIGKSGPTLDTTPSAGGPIGTVINDTATLHNASNPTGSIAFKLFGPNDLTCSKDPIYTQSVALNGTSAATTPGFTSIAAGTYEWTASYPGDGNNVAASSGCGAEAVVIAKNGPTIATTLSGTVVAIGTAVHDGATLTGVTSAAGGSVTYTIFSNNECAGDGRDAGTKTVLNGFVPDSNVITFDTAGTWYWQAVYGGDANHLGATSGCREEILTVSPADPTIATTLSSSTGKIGDTVHDSATLKGATIGAGGSVTYTVFTNSTCTAGTQDAGTVTVSSGVVPNSNPITFSSAGTWYWQAVYSGDANNKGAKSPCTEEVLLIVAPTPSPSISASPTASATATPTATSSGSEELLGVTSAPNATAPATNAASNSFGGQGSPLFALLICLILGAIAMLMAGKQRRISRR